MKKLMGITLSAIAALAVVGCASTGSAKNSRYKVAADKSVVGYYTFAEDVVDNEVVDHSANKINVYTSALDGSVLVDGIDGKGLSFNGEDEFITLDASALEGEGFTFAAWVKPEMWLTWTRIFDFGDTKADIFFGVDGRTPGTLVIREEGSQVQINTPLPEMGEWCHLAASFGDGRLTIYVDGVLAAEGECPTVPADIGATAQGIYVGRSNWPDPLFKGIMDNIVIANRVLTAEEIAALYDVNAAAAKAASVEEPVVADPFVIKADSGVIGYYTFDDGVENNEVVDCSGSGINAYTGTLDDSVVAV